MSHCGLIILAAGNSSRLGRPKQLLPFNGQSLLQHTISIALQVADPVIVVLGAKAHEIQLAVHHQPVHLVHNDNWSAGMASSIHCGLTALRSLSPTTGKVIITVCDQPYVSVELLQGLIHGQSASGQPIAACAYGDTTGIPALFHASLFPELMALTGDTGARKLIKQYADRTTTIPFPLGAIDIDTLPDYEKLTH